MIHNRQTNISHKDPPVILFFENGKLLIGWLIIAGACIIPFMTGILSESSFLSISWLFGPLNIMAVLCGSLGLVLMTLSLIFSTKLRQLEPLFAGMNRVYTARHLLIGLAAILLAFHEVFLLLRYGKDSWHVTAVQIIPDGLTPLSGLIDSHSQQHSQVLHSMVTFFGFLLFATLVVALHLTFLSKDQFRSKRILDKLIAPLLLVGGYHVVSVVAVASGSTILKLYLSFIVIVGVIASLYTVWLADRLSNTLSYQVRSVRLIGGNVTQILLDPVGEKLVHKPGQFIFIRFNVAGARKFSEQWHPFIVSSGPGEKSIELNVKSLGDYTSSLLALKPDTLAEIEGPFGSFSYTDYKNSKQIWIAGGVGITPFLSMARDLPPTGYKVDVYYAMNTAGEVIDWPSLNAIAKHEHGNFRVVPFVVADKKVLLSLPYIKELSGSFEGKEFLLCCPPAMTRAMLRQLLAAGVPRDRVHMESFALGVTG